MAPDRGSASRHEEPTYQAIRSSFDGDQEPALPKNGNEPERELEEQDQTAEFLAERAESDTNFTVRGVLVGLVIGVIVCFSNTYFGLQTGWISGMAMPASLVGFAFFKSIAPLLKTPFTPVENVLVQSVSGAVGTMPLGVGCVGVLPALNILLEPYENGPLDLSISKLLAWSVGICFFGVFVAVPLRKQVIIREKLRFPSGTATALMIKVLHRDKEPIENKLDAAENTVTDLPNSELHGRGAMEPQWQDTNPPDVSLNGISYGEDWRSKITLLTVAFGISALYTLGSYFIPQVRDLPILGLYLADQWLWTFNPSPAYVGQGIIMGTATTMHMLFGALLGWAVLSPMAKNNGWAPSDVSDWVNGSKGWIVWVSLAIMLADSLVNIGWLALRPIIAYGPLWLANARERLHSGELRSAFVPQAIYSRLQDSEISAGVTRLEDQPSEESIQGSLKVRGNDVSESDAPPEHLIGTKVTSIGFLIAVALCIAGVHIAFYDYMPFWATVVAIIFSLVLSLMGVRALGETDLNPVSGISKITQLAFALLTPKTSPNAIIINLVAGAISESAALQAGDLMQDLKAGHLLGASPAAQFYGQLIGSFVGAVAAALIYKLYTSVYTIPSGLFQIPTAYVWIFTARLVTGQGLPPGAWQWAVGSGLVWAIITAVRIYGKGTRWVHFLPGGIAVAVGMYNVPSFTLARTIGGLVTAYWTRWRGKDEETVIVLASGLILGEGVISILNLGLASLKVPHLGD